MNPNYTFPKSICVASVMRVALIWQQQLMYAYFSEQSEHTILFIRAPSQFTAMSTNHSHPAASIYTPMPHLGALRIIPIKQPEISPAQGSVMNQPM